MGLDWARYSVFSLTFMSTYSRPTYEQSNLLTLTNPTLFGIRPNLTLIRGVSTVGLIDREINMRWKKLLKQNARGQLL